MWAIRTDRRYATWVNRVRHNAAVPTLVFVHAHPDDEALLTAGTMAKAASEGHRVVLVMATDGAAGLARSDITDLADVRASELAESTSVLGVARTVNLGYRDSGLDGSVIGGLASTPVGQIASAIAHVVREENADILVGYDPSGGYGHPDHVQVHRSVRAAAASLFSENPCAQLRVFEATLPREPISRGVHLAARLYATPADFDPTEFDRAWTPRTRITHRVNVRGHLAAKRAAQAAHASQAGADDGVRTLQVLGKLPNLLARLILGTEFYVDVTAATMEAANVTSL